MRVQPIVFLEQLTDEQIQEHECSDRLWLPRREFERVVMESEPGVTTLLRLTNRVGQSVVGAVHSLHNNEDTEETIYAPQWMSQLLDLEDTITIERCEPSLCSRIVLQPHTSEHVSADEPLELLNHAFERYTCITSGTTIPLWLEGLGCALQATVVGMLPESSDTLCIRGSELELELLRPLDMPEVQAPPAGTAVTEVVENVIEHVTPVVTATGTAGIAGTTGTTAGTTAALSPAELRARMYEAAMKRLKGSEAQ